MIERDFLSIYNESETFNLLLSSFNVFSYFITVLFFSYLLILSSGLLLDSAVKENYVNVKIKKFFTQNFLSISLFASIILTLVNYFFGIYINLLGCFILAALISFLSFKNYQRTSAKWISFSSVVFITLLISIYILFWTLMNEQNSHLFDKFNINQYSIVYKDFFSIYIPGETNFNYLSFIDKYNNNIIVDNTIPYKRDLMYYYVLYSIAMVFWSVILRKIFVYHKLFTKIRL
jgi:hypothetical protein